MKGKKGSSLELDGILIRGQHEGDIPPTNMGIERANCACCGKEFKRWLESKMARLIRNEVEGSVHWESREFDRAKFDELKAVRMYEVKFCSEECQAVGVVKKPLKVRESLTKAVENSPEVRENSFPQGGKNPEWKTNPPKRRGQ